eukprot:1741110-Pyramimonas_sp.AAC.1
MCLWVAGRGSSADRAWFKEWAVAQCCIARGCTLFAPGSLFGEVWFKRGPRVLRGPPTGPSARLQRGPSAVPNRLKLASSVGRACV